MSYESYASYANSGAPSSSDIAALTASATTTNGTANYSIDPGTLATSTGSVINSSANPVTTNSGPVDASGGNGSLPSQLQGIATQGLDDTLVSAQEFGLGSLTDILRVGAEGTTTAASAPSPQGSSVSSGGIPTWLILAGAVVIVAVLIKTAR